jgi:NAD(P)-dependent dehydrogenase (short-subunit alcohol dehydrogenase family)
MSGERGKIVVVGAGSGIGAAVAAQFHDRGDYVLAVDIKPNETPASPVDPLYCKLYSTYRRMPVRSTMLEISGGKPSAGRRDLRPPAG